MTYGTPAPYGQAPTGRRLVRPRHGKVIAGVCAALADRFGISRTAMRLIFIVSCVLPGPQFLVYIAGWLLIPQDRY